MNFIPNNSIFPTKNVIALRLDETANQVKRNEKSI